MYGIGWTENISEPFGRLHAYLATNPSLLFLAGLVWQLELSCPADWHDTCLNGSKSVRAMCVSQKLVLIFIFRQTRLTGAAAAAASPVRLATAIASFLGLRSAAAGGGACSSGSASGRIRARPAAFGPPRTGWLVGCADAVRRRFEC